MTVSPYPQPS
jgi:hypothetical protein